LDFEDEKGVCMVLNSIAESLPYGVNVSIGSGTDHAEFRIPHIKERGDSVVGVGGLVYCWVYDEDANFNYYMPVENSGSVLDHE
jgi:hypothetical protein